MPRLMSVAFTEQAVRDRRKTVTRRKGWLFAKPGDRVTLCRAAPDEPTEDADGYVTWNGKSPNAWNSAETEDDL